MFIFRKSYFHCFPAIFTLFSKPGQVDVVESTGTCRRGDGRGYRGTISVTQNGKRCQPWTSQNPHQHPMLPSLFTMDLDDSNHPDHSYCRNPGGLGKQPWCYTNDRNVRWSYCKIPKCGKQLHVALPCLRLEAVGCGWEVVCCAGVRLLVFSPHSPPSGDNVLIVVISKSPGSHASRSVESCDEF